MGVVVIDGIWSGVICIYEGVWLDFEFIVGGICKNGVVNVLIKDFFSFWLGNGCVGNIVLVWFEKYIGLVLLFMVFDLFVNL